MKRSARVLYPLLLGTALLAAAVGCRSATVNATIENQGPAIQLVEFDYPSASFGVDRIAAGEQFHYPFKVLGSGLVTLTFEDASGTRHTVKGPAVKQGQEGSLTVTIGAGSAVRWRENLTLPRLP